MRTIETLRPHHAVESAVAEIAAGRAVVVTDDEDRENEGDLIFAAELATPELVAFLVRHCSGFLCVALPEAECERLVLPPLYHSNSDRYGTAFRVTVDSAEGVGTGISARDRARTARLLASATSVPADFTRPGHVVPLAARVGGVLQRCGHTESAVDLARLAGLRPAGVLCEIVSTRNPTRMAHGDEVVEFAARHGLALVSIAELTEYRRTTEQRVERVTETRLPTEMGPARTFGYRAADGSEHLALVTGDLAEPGVGVHVHVECLLGDVFRASRCGCARRLASARRAIAEAGRGVLIYLRPREHSALESLRLQGSRHSPLPICSPTDRNGYTAGILADLGVRSVRPLNMPPSMHAALAPFASAPESPLRSAGEVA